MDSPARALTVVLVAAAAALGAAPAQASAHISFGRCPRDNALACGRLTVPLDPGAPGSGTVSLAIRRRRAPLGAARSAVIALAGGPGQAAIPFTSDFIETLGPLLDRRDLIVFDQRGTGRSHPLACPALRSEGGGPIAGAVAECARQIGPSRRFYTTPYSVADIEAIRIAGNYSKLVLYGTSYGTKVALQYAQAHPSHVEALILDSVVAPNGPGAFQLSTFAAIPGVLRRLCALRQCAHITRNPVASLRGLLARIARRPLYGRAIGGHGRPHRVNITAGGLFELLLEGDLDPILRSEMPAALASAARGQPAMLARMLARMQSAGEGDLGEIDTPLYYTTTCEETLFPWLRSSTPKQRLAEAAAKLASLPHGAFAPFSARQVLGESGIGECAAWPYSTPAPPISSGPLPAVPTLILSGAEDLRTPTFDARRVAARIPGSHLVVVPNTGHDVLGTEPGSCGQEALRTLFSPHPPAACKPARPPVFLRPTPPPPRTLRALAPLPGCSGRAGRTLRALALTLSYLGREMAVAMLERGGSTPISSHAPLLVGGLRSGWSSLTRSALRLHSLSFVPGVTVTGTIRRERIVLRIGGSAAAHGTLRLGAHGALVGRLDHVRVTLRGHAAIAADSAADSARREPQAVRALGSTLARLSGGPALREVLSMIAFARSPGAHDAIASARR